MVEGEEDLLNDLFQTLENLKNRTFWRKHGNEQVSVDAPVTAALIQAKVRQIVHSDILWEHYQRVPGKPDAYGDETEIGKVTLQLDVSASIES